MNNPTRFIVRPLVLAAAILEGFCAQTEISRLLPFQGRLVNADGVAVPDGVKLVQFQIYGDPTGGSPLWAGEVHRTTVNGGLVNVMLGSKNPLPVNRADDSSRSFFDATLYLQITMDTSGPNGVPDNAITAADPPLLPRQAILPVVFASDAGLARNSLKLAGKDWSDLLVSGNDPAVGKIAGSKLQDQSIDTKQFRLGSITSAQIANETITTTNLANDAISMEKLNPGIRALLQNILTPPGTIAAFGGDNIPDGWLLCDGRAFSSSDPKYSRLYSAIKTNWGAGNIGSTNDFNLPDLQNIFLRGSARGLAPTDKMYSSDSKDRFALHGGNTNATVGSYELDQFGAHQHGVNTTGPFTDASQTRFGASRYGGAGGAFTSFINNVILPASSTEGGTETRPKNASVNYIIKY